MAGNIAKKSDKGRADGIFRILLGIDSIAALAVVYFFVVGLADGSISSFNMQLWIGILFAVAAIIAGGLAARRATKLVLANVVLAMLAVPAALYGVFIGAVVISGTPWN
ncbi:MAG: osmoprotectant transporter permease [Pseudomonadota bacterium]